MRAFFLLLVLVNLAYLGYQQLLLEGDGADSQILQLQVAAERIKLLKAMEQVPAESPRVPDRALPPVPPRTATAAPTTCLEWGIFAGPGVARAESALASLELPDGQVERTVSEAGGFWVYMAPMKSKAEVDRKVRELRDLGITEFFVVQDSVRWRNAISLGIFRTEEAAQAFRDGLKQRGVRSAIVARRENFLRQVTFYVLEPSEATVARLTLLQQEFPGSEMKAGPCPPTAG